MNPFDLRRLATAPDKGRIQIALECVIVSDPSQVAEEIATIGDLVVSGGRRRSAWFESYLAGRGNPRAGGVSTTPLGGTPSYHDRTCCYAHISDMERRVHALPMPYETRCPECRRLFRFQWGTRERF